MLIFNSLIASSETFQLSPNLRVIGYSNFYCCTGHNSFFVCFYVMPKLPECIWVSLGRGREFVWYFFKNVYTFDGKLLLSALVFNKQYFWPCTISLLFLSVPAASALHNFLILFFFPVNHIVFCMQTLHRTKKNLMKCPSQPITELRSACEKAAVIWPWLGSVFDSPCPVLAEESPAENCWLLSKNSLSATSWKA